MKKIVLFLAIFLFVGCSNGIFYLEDKYYNKGEYISISSKEINDNESFVLYTYNNFCALPVHCENIFKEVMEKNKIDVLSIPFEDFKNTSFYKKVKYAPSILIIRKGEIIAFLDANSDEDLEKYQDTNKFENWLKEYIYLEKNNN